MSAFVKFNVFTKNLVDGVHDFDGHTFKGYLTNATPLASNTIKANIAEIATGNGYNGPLTLTVTTDTATGTAKVFFGDKTITASGPVGPFSYFVVYNDTPTSPADPLIGYIDLRVGGAAVTLGNGDVQIIDFNGTTGAIIV